MLAARAAEAQPCFAHVRDIPYSPSYCDGDPAHNRVFRMQVISWKGRPYLFVNEGNEIHAFSIDDPITPLTATRSHFMIPYFGDVDYNLLNFTVCDDCRFGVANFNTSAVLFDLGTADVPEFVEHHVNTTSDRVAGSFTFSHGGQQYLIASDLGPDPCPGNDSGLYLFDEVDDGNLTRLQCLEGGGSFGVEIANGLKVDDGQGGAVLFLGDRYSPLRVYRVIPGGTLSLEHVGELGSVKMLNTMGAAVAAGLLAVVYAGELSVHDIGWGTGRPDSPVLLSTTTVGDDANTIAMHFPLVRVSSSSLGGGIQTYDVSSPGSPLPVDQSFWDPSQPWNSVSACIRDTHGAFSPDGATLYLSRWSVLQIIDSSTCIELAAPDGGTGVDAAGGAGGSGGGTQPPEGGAAPSDAGEAGGGAVVDSPQGQPAATTNAASPSACGCRTVSALGGGSVPLLVLAIALGLVRRRAGSGRGRCRSEERCVARV